MARTTIRTEDITASAVTSAKIASGAVDTSGLEDDIALLGFRVASNGSLAKYNLVDQTVDDFQDTSGVDASASTNESRDGSGKYYAGATFGSYIYSAQTSTGAGTWTAPTSVTEVEAVIVAGGGGGGSGPATDNESGGGGGGGGVVYASAYTVVPAVVYDLTVGAGGAGGTGNNNGVAGSNSVFNVNAEGSGATMTASGGGYGGGAPTGAGNDGGAGGSGGGGGYKSGGGGSGTQADSGGGTGYGNDGGAGSSAYAAGGGGGAAAVGAAGVANAGGAGGAGRLFSNFTSYGADSGYFAGGGGGGGSPGAAGGTGGGGAGGYNSAGTAGTVNTGGGGGGGEETSGGAGGSGTIVLRYRTNVEGANMTLVSTTTAAQAAPTKGDIVLTYTNGAGTTTLDTDLTAEISADGGSTWTDLPLASEGSTGSHNIATSHDITIDSTITDPYNMAYRIKTLNQSVSKTTRIQAVSLGWS